MSRQRVANLVRVRNIQERVARAGVAKAQHEHLAALHAEREVWESLAGTRAHLQAATDASSLLGAQHLIQSGLSLARMRNAVAEAAHLDLQRELHVWGGAAQRLEATERWAERVTDRAEFELEHKSSIELEDLTMARHLMKQAS